MRNLNHHAISLFVGVSALALASAAGAQTTPAASELDAVIVTGSRIIQNGNNMPTPVTVVSTDQLLQTQPRTVVEALQQLPVFSGTRNNTSQPGNGGGNGVGRNLNLRNVGATRTLVLFDGIRVPPTTQGGEVNADFVPSMLLQRVDVVTGGASAVYGSDAVAGVVNFVTDRNFNGYKFDAQFGRSQLGDGDEMKFGIAGGTKLFDGRGHIQGSYEYFNSPGIFSKLDREFGKNALTVQGAGTAANPIRLVYNSRLTRSSTLGLIPALPGINVGNPLRDMVFRSNGVLDKFRHGTPTGSVAVESGGDGAYFYNASLENLFQSDLGYGRFDYDLTDKVHFYAQATGMLSHVKNNHETVETTTLLLSPNNAFLAPQYQQQMLAALPGLQSFQFQKFFTQVDAKSPESYVRAYMANVGLEGDIAGWKWNVGYLNSANQQATRLNRNINNGRFFAAVDAVRAPNGSIVCNVTLTNPGLYPGCVPVNLFGPTSETPEMLNYFLETTKFETTTHMDTVSGSITGNPFSTWAGEVGVAVSAEWRKLTYQLQSSVGDNAKLNCTGLRFNCNANTNGWQNDVRANRSEVSQSVKEAALEVNVPLLKDVPFAESLIVNGAYRVTNYSNSGTVSTWKLGGDWDVNSQITFRATRSRDIRAPNLTELYGTRSVTPAGPPLDLHIGQTPPGIVSFITDSNPNLTPEIATTWTAGVVLRPEFLPRFSLAIDWYKISIQDAIANVQGQNLVIQRICEESGGTSPTCAQQIRPFPFSNRTTANFATGWVGSPQNLASFDTDGVDFEANYSVEALGGNVSTRLLGTYQPTSKQENFPGSVVLNNAGAAPQPVWRVAGFVKYQRGDWSLDVQERWYSSMKWNADPTLVYAVDGDLPAIAYTNATLGYKMGDANFFLSIQNLFDKQPTPYGVFGGAGTVPGLQGGFINPLEDTLGRFYTVGVRIRH